MTNVIEEILYQLKENNLTQDDISWIGSQDGEYAMEWSEFKEKFKDIEYNHSFGAQELASDLIIVMKNGTYFDRSEYDGSEGWDYHNTPLKQKASKTFDVISVNQVSEIGWRKLKELNKPQKNCIICGNVYVEEGNWVKDKCYPCRRDEEMQKLRDHMNERLS